MEKQKKKYWLFHKIRKLSIISKLIIIIYEIFKKCTQVVFIQHTINLGPNAEIVL